MAWLELRFCFLFFPGRNFVLKKSWKIAFEVLSHAGSDESLTYFANSQRSLASPKFVMKLSQTEIGLCNFNFLCPEWHSSMSSRKLKKIENKTLPSFTLLPPPAWLLQSNWLKFKISGKLQIVLEEFIAYTPIEYRKTRGCQHLTDWTCRISTGYALKSPQSLVAIDCSMFEC